MHAWIRELVAATRSYTDDIDDEHATTIQQARNHEAADPLAFDWAKPGEPGVPDRARILLRYIEQKKRERAELAAYRARTPPNRPGTDPDRPRSPTGSGQTVAVKRVGPTHHYA